MASAPSLTVVHGTPAAQVEVVISGLPSGVAYLTVFRTAGGVRLPVSGAIRRSVSSEFSSLDPEPPFDVELSYQAETFDVNGASVGFTDSSSITVWSPTWADGKPRVCLHNPLDPGTAVWVRLAPTAGALLRRPVIGQFLPGEGRRLPMISAGRRMGLSAASLDVISESWEAGERVSALFGDEATQRLPVVCVRIPQELRHTRWPVLWFAGVLDAQGETHPVLERIVWRMEATEVARPVPALVMPLLRRVDVAAYYPSRRAVADGNESRFALSRNYEIAGVGG